MKTSTLLIFITFNMFVYHWLWRLIKGGGAQNVGGPGYVPRCGPDLNPVLRKNTSWSRRFPWRVGIADVTIPWQPRSHGLISTWCRKMKKLLKSFHYFPFSGAVLREGSGDEVDFLDKNVYILVFCPKTYTKISRALSLKSVHRIAKICLYTKIL